MKVLAKYGNMWSGLWSGCTTKLIYMLLRNLADVLDFQRVFLMLVQQWFRKSFDEEKEYLKSINLGILPSLPSYCGPPGGYPLWIEKLYQPWHYLDYPDGGFLQNNPLLYPIQECSGKRPQKPKICRSTVRPKKPKPCLSTGIPTKPKSCLSTGRPRKTKKTVSFADV